MHARIPSRRDSSWSPCRSHAWEAEAPSDVRPSKWLQRTTYSRASTSIGPLPPVSEASLVYLMRLMMLNIGMYRAMTAAPTAPPMMAINSGSIKDVSASTAAETSEL